MIRYPSPLKRGDLIGITAPSSGVTGVFAKKLDYAKKQLEAKGYRFIETESVKKQNKLTSAPAKIRAEEFTALYLDENVKAIIPPWGGEFLMDMLPYIDFHKLERATPKWIMGFSDTSTLLFTLTLKLNIATAHGPNLLDFGNTAIDESVLEALNILNKEKGDEFTQHSLELYQKEWFEVAENKFPPYNLSEKVEWKVMGQKDEVNFNGRLIGGNLDVICKLIGTPFDLVRDYITMHETEGLIWYFESCSMDSSDVYRTLWQMKQNGWFKACNGMLFGRPEECDEVEDFTLIYALESALSELDIPVVYDVDLGHLPPQLTFINGALANINVVNGKGTVKQKLI